jgi:hypothetical protein
MFGIGPWELVIIALTLLILISPAVIAVVVMLAVSRSSASSMPANPNLTPCPDCGNRVSRQATACPRCGRPLK